MFGCCAFGHANRPPREIVDRTLRRKKRQKWKKFDVPLRMQRVLLEKCGPRMRSSETPRWCSRLTFALATVPLQSRSYPLLLSTRRFSSVSTPSHRQHEPAAHSHRFLSASEVIRLQAAAARDKFTGLSFVLPPFCAWGASAQFGQTTENTTLRHGSSKHYSDLWAPIESYVVQVRAASSGGSMRGAFGIATSDPSPPLCLVLRLFPDLIIAKLPALSGRGKEGPQAPRRGRCSYIAPHEYPLDAILGAEELWGSGADPRQVFRSAIEALHELGQRLLPQLPLVLQIPTRLLVSQQFLEDLATLLIRDGWRSVSFELPSTHQLYSSRGESYGADSSWCRLPLLCTSWPSLCHHPRLGKTLQQLRRHDVVPFHVLYSWAVAEKQLFNGLEQAIVVDTTAPMPGEEALRACMQGPSSVGKSAEELHCVQSHPTHQLCDVTGATPSVFQADDYAHSLRESVYMSENPSRTRRHASGIFDSVVDAVRQRGQCAASRQGHQANLDHASGEWQLRRRSSASLPPADAMEVAQSEIASSAYEDSVSVVFDAPPDHLRALIEKSIVSGDATAPSSLPQQEGLLQKVGEFLQHTMVEPAASDSSNFVCQTSKHASLEDEAEELGRLLKVANETGNMSTEGSEAEQLMAEMHRLIGRNTQSIPYDIERGAEVRSIHEPSQLRQRSTHGTHNTHSPSTEITSNVWSTFPGYWSCIRALVQQLTNIRLLWTAPTFNKTAVDAWVSAYHASLSSGETGDEPHMFTRDAPLPLVVPVYMPIQSVMHVEVERLLREGRRFERPPLLLGREEETALHTWLPAFLNAALTDALSKLPASYQGFERRRLLFDHQRLRSEGAHAARCISSVMEAADRSPVGSESVEDDTEHDTVYIRFHQERRPLYLLTPAQVESFESQAFKEAAAISVASREEGAALDKCVRRANEEFAQAVEEGYRGVSSTSDRSPVPTALPAGFLHVPTPGLDVNGLRRSWCCLSA